MSCFISSQQNRFYTALESEYGQLAEVTADHRIPAIRLSMQQETRQSRRRDKTGSRTQGQLPAGIRKRNRFRLETYMTAWNLQKDEPVHGPLIRAALGAAPRTAVDLIVASVASVENPSTGLTPTNNQLTFATEHNLTQGQGLSFGGEIRFVEEVSNATTVRLNTPFSLALTTGSQMSKVITYAPATALPSVSIYDYWSPATAVQRILMGTAVDQMTIRINSDFHEFQFAGEARQLIDSTSFNANPEGLAVLNEFPEEPALNAQNAPTLIPGHLGQVWFGPGPEQFFTLTEAEVVINNNIDLRQNEFGNGGVRCIAGGVREVGLRFSLISRDNAATNNLYAAAQLRQPISAMLQLGTEPGKMCAIYLPRFIPEVPEFNDRQPRLEWNFALSGAVGTNDDELRIAFA